MQIQIQTCFGTGECAAADYISVLSYSVDDPGQSLPCLALLYRNLFSGDGSLSLSSDVTVLH